MLNTRQTLVLIAWDLKSSPSAESFVLDPEPNIAVSLSTATLWGRDPTKLGFTEVTLELSAI